ncbi:ester cyclase [Duganella vulcania]|uniref:Ester cyclase n=1 Tax=Duganella vulcania TaxID=2692166 RepID=A0A845GQJ7_9BURK|nr:ester cyclase [Duganella vulcania]MYM95845.1 ester cyclase [Duganella vulcania]
MKRSLLLTALLLAGAANAHATDLTEQAARRYAAFWNTGDPALAKQALSPDFMDRTLPAGREQGVNGPLQASKGFRTAVPDLKAEITDMVVNGDRVAVHLHFTGHFTGSFGATSGKGQPIDFRAFDLYRVADGRIAENWHLEDNLTLLQQMGVMPGLQSAPAKTQ